MSRIIQGWLWPVTPNASKGNLPTCAKVETPWLNEANTLNRIGSNDMLIAAQALALDCTVITANDREFSRVPGLKVENWLE